MNTFSKATLFATAVALSFSACKKGEDDPFLSLRSRDARITNTWNLTSIDGTSTYIKKTPSEVPVFDQYGNPVYDSNGNQKTETIITEEKTVSTTKFSGSTKTETSTKSTTTDGDLDTADPATTTSTYSKELDIKKDGEVTITEVTTVLSSTDPFVTTGVTNTSKETTNWYWAEDNKAKSTLVINYQKYEITKLSKKELVLKVSSSDDDSSTKNAQTQGSNSSTNSTTYTYEAK